MKEFTVITTSILVTVSIALLVVIAINSASTKSGTTLNIKDMTQRQCDDIVSKPNAYTGKRDLICEIQMVEEDDNIIILKEN